MTPERIAALEAVPGWFWEEDRDAAWEANLALLRDYVKENKKLPIATAEFQGVKLGKWVNHQRSAKKGQTGGYRMTPERIAALEAVPGWKWEEDKDADWDVNLAILCDYVEEHNKLPTQKTEFQGVKLGRWIGVQRRAKKGQGGYKITPERIAALEAVPGWKW